MSPPNDPPRGGLCTTWTVVGVLLLVYFGVFGFLAADDALHGALLRNHLPQPVNDALATTARRVYSPILWLLRLAGYFL